MIIGKLVNDRYKVTSKIDEGGMANIFLAKDTVFDKDVVLKVLKEEYYEQRYISQFKHEVESLAELSHENIIKVFDYYESEDMYYIVMEFLDGITLKDLIRKKTTISPQMTVDIISKVSSALKHAHSFGLVHRDIKPQNIMILKDATIKLMDFGISKHVDELKEYDENDDSNSVMGSVHYISPEQVRGDKIDQRSDIYALGIVMYEMLVGKVPYNGKNAVDIALMHLKQHIGNISDINPLVPQSLSNVVIRTTSPDIKLRHQDIQSFEYDLTTCLMPNRLNESLLSFVDKSKEDSLSKTQLIDLNNEKIRKEIEIQKTASNSDFQTKEDEWDWRKISIIGGLIAFLFIALLFIYGSSNRNLMPDLSGKTYEESKIILSDQLDIDISSGNINYERNKKVDEGKVWKQMPLSGSRIESSMTANSFVVTINDTSKTTYKIKDYSGMNIADAEKELTDNFVKVKIDYVENSDVLNKNQIISQSVKPDTEMKQSDLITFKVSKNNKSIKLPSLSDLTIEKLKNFANKNDMNIKDRSDNKNIKSSCKVSSFENGKENSSFDITNTLYYRSDCSSGSLWDYIGSFFGFKSDTENKSENSDIKDETTNSQKEAIDEKQDIEMLKKKAKDRIWESNLSFFTKVTYTTKISFSDNAKDIKKITEDAFK